MTGPEDQDPSAELQRLAEDWIALWQSELAGLAADPELAEAWSAALAQGAAWLRAMAPRPQTGASAAGWPAPAWPWPPAGMPPMATRPPGHPGFPWPAPADDRATAPPRPAPTAAAPADGDVAQQRGAAAPADADGLAARVAELERRLAEVEGSKRGGKPDHPGPRRPRRKA